MSIASTPPAASLGSASDVSPVANGDSAAAASTVSTTRKRSRAVSRKVASGAMPAPAKFQLLNRDQSILSFTERVLDWARRPDVPLLERLRYVCIVSSNLDEFFEVRAAAHMSAQLSGDKKGAYTDDTFQALATRIHALVEEQYRIYNQDLLPALEKRGIKVLAHSERNASQRRWVKDYFVREVQPLLVPVGLDPAHPFPQVANKTLTFIVRLNGRDAFGRENEVAIVKVPRFLPRFLLMPAAKGSKQQLFVSISSLIRAHLVDLFPGRHVTEFSQFRVTRHSDLAVDEDEVKNLRTALRKGLQHRHYGQSVRLEVSAGCSEFLSDFLLQQFGLPVQALYRVAGPVNLVRLNQLIDLVDAPAMRFEHYAASWPHQLVQGQSFFERLQQGDVLIHQPYESFDAVLAFLREAVEDPNVLAIKQTIYRTGARSELMDLLREAVRRGKEVTAVVELKARFDEEANINYAERLESVGAQVVYGVVGLKTHAKMMLITRREGGRLVRYAHLSTGNYNPGTARLYTDVSHLTVDETLTADIEHLFLHLASQNRLPRLHKALTAPFHLHKAMLERMEAASRAALAGQRARIVLKMNALTDEVLARALAHASQCGVQVDVIVRGACILPPGLPGVTHNIRIRSVIGRLLEHSRVFHFQIGDDDQLWLSSADWMNRNMLRRVELAWPVTDPQLKQRVIHECLDAYLADTCDAWLLRADGSYERVTPALAKQANGKSASKGVQDGKPVHQGRAAPSVSAQRTLMARYGRKG